MVSRKAKLRIEAPVNGGRNYEPGHRARILVSGFVVPKTKLGYVLEHPVSIRRYSLQIEEAVTMRSVRTISRKDNSGCKNRKSTSGNWILPGGL